MKFSQELLIKPSAIKRIVKEKGKRTGSDFLESLNNMVHSKIASAVQIHNGGKKTLDREVAVLVGGK